MSETFHVTPAGTEKPVATWLGTLDWAPAAKKVAPRRLIDKPDPSTTGPLKINVAAWEESIEAKAARQKIAAGRVGAMTFMDDLFGFKSECPIGYRFFSWMALVKKIFQTPGKAYGPYGQLLVRISI